MGVELKIVPMTKVCSRCKTAKSYDAFVKTKDSKVGVRTYCNDCRNESRRNKVLFEIPEFKVCSRCDVEKHNTEFTKNKDRKIGITPDCKSCRNARYKDPRRNRKDQWPRKYGVTYEQVVQALHEQNGLCGNRGCGKEISLTVAMGPTRAVVDHDHKTGKFRAVLCMKCNTDLGVVENNVNRSLGLIEYLNKHTLTVGA